MKQDSGTCNTYQIYHVPSMSPRRSWTGLVGNLYNLIRLSMFTLENILIHRLNNSSKRTNILPKRLKLSYELGHHYLIWRYKAHPKKVHQITQKFKCGMHDIRNISPLSLPLVKNYCSNEAPVIMMIGIMISRVIVCTKFDEVRSIHDVQYTVRVLYSP